MYQSLENCILFKGIASQQISHLMNSVVYGLREYRKGDFVVFSGDPCISLKIVVAGKVKAEMSDISGKVLKIEEIGVSGSLAHGFLFGDKNFYPVDVIAIQDTKIVTIHKEAVLLLMKKEEKVLINFLNSVSNKAHFLSERMKFLSMKSIAEKVGHYLLGIAKVKGMEFDLPSKQQDLAESFGVTRPSLARTIGELRARGIAEISGKHVRIIDLEALKLFS